MDLCLQNNRFTQLTPNREEDLGRILPGEYFVCSNTKRYRLQRLSCNIKAWLDYFTTTTRNLLCPLESLYSFRRLHLSKSALGEFSLIWYNYEPLCYISAISYNFIWDLGVFASTVYSMCWENEMLRGFWMENM